MVTKYQMASSAVAVSSVRSSTRLAAGPTPTSPSWVPARAERVVPLADLGMGDSRRRTLRDHLSVTVRHVPLEGNYNLRDLGGYVAVDGRSVRYGCLYRSDQLCHLTDADLDAFQELGIRVVFDLRNEAERAAFPSRIPEGVEVRERTSPGTDAADVRTLEQVVASGDLPARDDELRGSIYVELLDRLAPELNTILTLAADAQERPLLFHCAAGKDRTGLTAALLLGLLGVPEDDILDDYELTSVYFGERRLESLSSLLETHGVQPDRVRPLLHARRPVLVHALRHLDQEWGGMEGYAIERLGVVADLPERLREHLLV